MSSVTYFLTIYNESESIPSILESLSKVSLAAPYNTYSVFAVDDASTDATPRVLFLAKEKYPLEVVRYEKNIGVPETFRRGFRHFAETLNDDDVVILMESDGTSDPGIISVMLSKIAEGNDIVIASREISGGKYLGFPWYRVLGSRCVNLYLRTLWRVRGASDYTIFYRAYKVSILKKCFTPDFEFYARKSFAANGEILLRMKHFRPKIAQVPLKYNYGLKRGASRMKVVATLAEYFRLTVKYYLSRI